MDLTVISHSFNTENLHYDATHGVIGLTLEAQVQVGDSADIRLVVIRAHEGKPFCVYNQLIGLEPHGLGQFKEFPDLVQSLFKEFDREYQAISRMHRPAIN